MPKVYSYYFEELLFKFSFERKDGADSPAWTQYEDYPPLPPREAIAASKATLLEMLKDFPEAEPKFHYCALKKTSEYEGNWWYYDIGWMVWPPECDEGDRSEINVPVMLNGRVPSFEVFKYEDRQDAWTSWQVH